MLLEYKNLRIRNATERDAEQLARWWNDGAVMAHAGFPNGLGTTAQKIAQEIQSDSDDTRRRLVIERDGVPIGEMSCRNAGNGAAEIGIKICEASERNKGIGKALLSMLIAALFDEPGYEKIILDTNLKNERAQHVYEQLGFRKLHVNVDSWRDQLGKLQSSVDYELLPADFVNYAK